MKPANQTIREEPVIRRVELERFSLTTSRPLDQVVGALNAAIGHPNIKEFWESAHRAKSMAELESVVPKSVGSAGLMLFVEFDHGSVVRKETRSDTPRIVRFLIGNPLIMKEMAKHVPDAGSYALVTVLINERPDGVHLSYDRMASLLKPYGNAEALKVAKDLDAKLRRYSNRLPVRPKRKCRYGTVRERKPALPREEGARFQATSGGGAGDQSAGSRDVKVPVGGVQT